MRHFIIICFAALIAFFVLGAEPRPSNALVPKSGETREEVLAAIEKLKDNGIVEWTETSRPGRHILVVWYCPFSGRAAVYVHAYYFDDKEWHLFWDTLLKGTHDLSVELPADKDVLRCRGADGSVVHTEPLDKVPKLYDKKHFGQK
jgi:hypothetical protein